MKNLKSMTEGAIFAAIFALLAFMTMILPLLSSVLLWILPTPFIVYTVRNGWRPGVILWVVASFSSFIIGGPLLFFMAIMFGSSGVIVGELIKRKKQAFIVLLGGSLAYIGNLLINFVVSIVIFDLHPIKVIQDLMLQSVEAAQTMLLAIGQDPGKQLDQLIEFINRLMYLSPSLLIATGVFYALFIQLIAYAVLKRIGEKVPHFKPFREWSFPKSFLWYYLVVSVLVLVGLEEGTAIYLVTWNLFPLLEIAMTIQGLAVVFFYCHAKKLKKSISVIIIIVSILAPFLLYIYRILGIIDLGFDLRKKLKNSN